MRRCYGYLLMIVVMLTANAAVAKTPDGLTPSEETVCSNLTGAAFGLCNAYCEAMDCHLAQPQASATACSRVRSNFQRITGSDLPCESFACPCQVLPEFNSVVSSTTAVSACAESPGTLSILTVTDTIVGVGVNDAGEQVCTSNNQFIVLTPAEAESCTSLLLNVVTTQGLSCFSEG